MSDAPKKTDATTRRGFVKTAAAAAVAAPYFAPARVFGAEAPSNRVTLACIGVGNQGFPVMKRFLTNAECHVLAVCDVNRGSNGYKEDRDIYGREPAVKEVESYYGKQSASGSYKGCDGYNDFREILTRDDIDAVVIATPDHWHASMTVMACKAGKDVYCEKPLGLTIQEQQAMVKAVRENNVVLQTGSHERSNPVIRAAVDLVRGGAIGKVRRVLAHVGTHNKVGPGPGWEPTPVPEGFDYDMWLGPAPKAPYHKDRCLYRFRFNYDYAGGQVANFGAHSLDIAQWGLGTDNTGPTKIECVYAEFLPEGSLFNAATHTNFRCTYDNGVVLECFTGHPAVRTVFEGEEGMVRVDNKGQNFVTVPRKLKAPLGKVKDLRVYASNDDHQRNFIDCVKSRSEPNAPVEVGHRSATICHLGNIAVRLGAKKLKWDPESETFEGSGSEQANAMLGVESRKPWQV
ncbi:MAG: Gfo/Idh/MocA family oxidoreductase [Planctomycetota bacterium]